MTNRWTVAVFVLGATLCMAQGTPQVAVRSSTANANRGGTQNSDPVVLEPEAKGQPHTEMLNTTESTHDPLLEPKPLPEANLALIGGVVRKVDTIHNRITLQPFGGGDKYVIYFDERTRILSAGRETTFQALHPGDRVYADTQALGARVFARTLQVKTAGSPLEASGQIIGVLGGQVSLEDRLSGREIHFTLTGQTKIESHGAAVPASELHSGSLVDVTFLPGKVQSNAQSITIHATPGESYVFAGTVTNVDLREGVLAVDNKVDGNNYELYFNPEEQKSIAQLSVGAPVSVTANFDGKRYRATAVQVTQHASEGSVQ